MPYAGRGCTPRPPPAPGIEDLMAQPTPFADTRSTDRTKGSDFAPLLREVKDAGLLDRRTASYLIAIGLNVLLIGATCAGIILLGNSWLQLLLAIPLALVTTR